jgi:UDP-N-acetylmuramoylalanine-D-glutamate ligase
MKKILIIGCGKDQIKLIKAAKKLKFIVTGVDKEKKNKNKSIHL